MDTIEARKIFKITNTCLVHCYHTKPHTFYSLFYREIFFFFKHRHVFDSLL